MIPVSQVMTSDVEPLLGSQCIAEATPIIAMSQLPGLPVVDKNRRLLGVVFKKDIELWQGANVPLVKLRAGGRLL